MRNLKLCLFDKLFCLHNRVNLNIFFKEKVSFFNCQINPNLNKIEFASTVSG